MKKFEIKKITSKGTEEVSYKKSNHVNDFVFDVVSTFSSKIITVTADKNFSMKFYLFNNDFVSITEVS